MAHAGVEDLPSVGFLANHRLRRMLVMKRAISAESDTQSPRPAGLPGHLVVKCSICALRSAVAAPMLGALLLNSTQGCWRAVELAQSFGKCTS